MIKKLAGYFDTRDFHLYTGTAMLAAGAWLLLPAAGLIAAGLVFLYVALRRVK